MTFNVAWSRGRFFSLLLLTAGLAAAVYARSNPALLDEVARFLRSAYLLP